VINVKEEVEL